eukprot:4227729-Karenia_brevis.AAC.1
MPTTSMSSKALSMPATLSATKLLTCWPSKAHMIRIAKMRRSLIHPELEPGVEENAQAIATQVAPQVARAAGQCTTPEEMYAARVELFPLVKWDAN